MDIIKSLGENWEKLICIWVSICFVLDSVKNSVIEIVLIIFLCER